MTAVWARPNNDAGIWHLSPARPRLRLTYLGTVVVSFAFLAAFCGAVAVGQRAMCAVDRHAYGHAAHQYCSDFHTSQTRTAP